MLASVAPVQTSTTYAIGSLVTFDWQFTDPDGDPVQASLDVYADVELADAVAIGRIADLQRQISAGHVTISFRVLVEVYWVP